MDGYDFNLSSKAVHTILGTSPRWRRQSMEAIGQLVENPFITADLQETSNEGRTYLTLVRENVVLTYWVDHGSRIIHIMLVELVKE
ncbi:MAG: hypothetical protein ABII82_12910 [Verrucomicrobiota bacterium]